MKAVQTINLVYRLQINNHVQLLFEGQFIFLRTVESKKWTKIAWLAFPKLQQNPLNLGRRQAYTMSTTSNSTKPSLPSKVEFRKIKSLAILVVILRFFCLFFQRKLAPQVKKLYNHCNNNPFILCFIACN